MDWLKLEGDPQGTIIMKVRLVIFGEEFAKGGIANKKRNFRNNCCVMANGQRNGTRNCGALVQVGCEGMPRACQSEEWKKTLV